MCLEILALWMEEDEWQRFHMGYQESYSQHLSGYLPTNRIRRQEQPHGFRLVRNFMRLHGVVSGPRDTHIGPLCT